MYYALKCPVLRFATSTAFHKHIVLIPWNLCFPVLTRLADSKVSFDCSDRKSLLLVPSGLVYKIIIKAQ